MPPDEVNGYLVDDQPEIPVDLVCTLLGFVRRRLGLDIAWLSSFHDGMEVIEVLDGDADAVVVFPGKRSVLAESYCVRIIEDALRVMAPLPSKLLMSGL